MAIAFVAASTVVGSSSTTNVVLPKPTGSVEKHVIVAVVCTYQGNTITNPSGWTTLNTQDGGAGTTIRTAYRVVGPSDGSTYTFTLASATEVYTASAITFSGVSNTNPIRTNASNSGSAVTTLVSPSLTGVQTGDYTVILAGGRPQLVDASFDCNGPTDNSWISPSAAHSGPSASTFGFPAATDLSYRTAYTTGTFAFSSIADVASGAVALVPEVQPDSVTGTTVANSPTVTTVTGPSIVQMTGFEHGSSLGFTSGVAGKRLFDFTSGVLGTNLVVQNSVARQDGYALRCVSTTSQVANVYWTTASMGTPAVLVGRYWFNVEDLTGAGPSDLPAIMHINPTVSSGNTTFLEYRESNGDLVMTLGGGTAQTAAGVVALNKWVAIDFRLDYSGSTWTCDWRVNGVAQTQATYAAGAATVFKEIRFGTNSAYNIILSYDDIALSTTAANYPLPNYHIKSLAVNGSGTHVNSGNFNQTTNNGSSMVAISSPHNLVDDLPPVVSSSTDAVGQVTNSNSSYLEFTHADAPATTIYGVKHVLAGWQDASGAAPNLAIVLRDGSTDGNTIGTPAAPVDPSFVNSTSTLAWANQTFTMAPSGGFWTSAKVNALTTRVGWSTSTARSPGINAAYIEVALAETKAPSETATGSTTANAPVARVGGASGTVTSSVTANSASVRVGPSPAVITAAASYPDATADNDLRVEPTVVSGAVTANSANVIVGAKPSSVTGAVTTNTPSTRVSFSAGTVTGAATANSPVGNDGAKASSVTGVVAANDAVIRLELNPTPSTIPVTATVNSPSTRISLPAGTATGSVVANNATASVGPSPSSAPVTATANNGIARVAPQAVTVTGSVVTNNATVSTTSNTNAPAETTTVSTVANNAVTAISGTAEEITAVVTAENATVTTSSSTNAPAGEVLVSSTANNAAIRLGSIATTVEADTEANNSSAGITTTAQPVTASTQANNAVAGVALSTVSVTGTVVANNATATTSSNTNAPAELTSASVVVNNAQVAIAASSGTALASGLTEGVIAGLAVAAPVVTGTSVAQNSSIAVAAVSEAVFGSVTANNATVSTVASEDADAGVASSSGVANSPTTNITTVAASTTASVAVPNASVLVGEVGAAENVSGTGTAYSPSIRVATLPQPIVVEVTTYGVNILGSTNAQAEVASADSTVFSPTIETSSSPSAISAAATANNAMVACKVHTGTVAVNAVVYDADSFESQLNLDSAVLMASYWTAILQGSYWSADLNG